MVIKKMKRKSKRGVPVGYKIPGWAYHGVWRETKTAPGTWRISFRATKNRKAKGYGGHPKGRRIRWKITAFQDVIKIGKGKYQTHMYGVKKLVKAGLNRLRKRKRK